MTQATVKWFNPTKGFGFVTFEDGTPDAFLHVSVVERAGLASLAEGTVIDCEVGQGQKGPQIERIMSIDESTASPSAAPASAEPGGSVEGVVKWFNPDKGFGFVQPDNGGKDVFLHISVVERAGIGALYEGQRVRLETSAGQKGPQAEAIELL